MRRELTPSCFTQPHSPSRTAGPHRQQRFVISSFSPRAKLTTSTAGIAAVKEIRSIRKWAYETFGSERAVEFTVMATPDDLKVNADYIRMADQYVEVPGGTNNNNYANVDVIVDVAERAGVHAVWAGWCVLFSSFPSWFRAALTLRGFAGATPPRTLASPNPSPPRSTRSSSSVLPVPPCAPSETRSPRPLSLSTRKSRAWTGPARASTRSSCRRTGT